MSGSALIVVISLTGTALAMAFSGKDDPSSGIELESSTRLVSQQRGNELSSQANPNVSFDLSSIKRISPRPSKNSELFQSKSWYSAPPPLKQQISSLPPPPPTAPQLPYTFSGRMIDGDQVILFLSKNGRQYMVKVGDILDETYRLERVSNVNAVLIYLPLNIEQSLTFNSTAIGTLTENDIPQNKPLQTSPSDSNTIAPR